MPQLNKNAAILIAAFLVSGYGKENDLVTPTTVSAAAEAAASPASRATASTTSATATSARPAAAATVAASIWTAIATFRGAFSCSGSGKRRIPVEIGLVVWKIAAALDG